MGKLKLNPVRVYAIAVSAMAIVAHYAPSLPTALYLSLVAAVLGVGGEVVRSQVTPVATAEKQASAAYAEGVEDAIAQVHKPRRP